MLLVLISKTLSDSYINHDAFYSVSNVLREYNNMKKEIKYLENAVEYTENKKSTDWKTKQKRLMLVSNCASCCKKKSNFINKEEARRLDFH